MAKKGLVKMLGVLALAGFLGFVSGNACRQFSLVRQRNELAEANLNVLTFYSGNMRFPFRGEIDIPSKIDYSFSNNNYFLWECGKNGKKMLEQIINDRQNDVEMALHDNSVRDAAGHPFYLFGKISNRDMILMNSSRFERLMNDKPSSVPVMDRWFASIFTGHVFPNAVAIGYLQYAKDANSKRDPEKAIKVYELISRVDEQNFDRKEMAGLYHNLGIAYYKKGERENELRVYLKALEIFPEYDNGELYNNMGLIYGKKGDYDKAESCYQKAIKLGDKLAVENIRSIRR